MPFEKSRFVWMDGKYVEWDNAQIHILSHVIHYGSAVFEGLRCYKTPKGSVVFRLKEHTERLFDSAKIYRMEIPYSQKELNNVQIEIIRKNALDECYIRPIAYRGYGEPGVSPFKSPVCVSIAIWKWGKYLGPEALDKGIDVMVSSWRRMAPDTMPAMAKCAANYMDSQLIRMESSLYGFAEGIALDIHGYVSEGSGENIFLVKQGVLFTPPLSASVLPGITRNTVMTLAKEMGIEVKEQNIPRELLYIADEVFMTGSAAEITPIRSVDKIVVGEGIAGTITRQLQTAFFDYIEGRREDKFGWLTHLKLLA